MQKEMISMDKDKKQLIDLLFEMFGYECFDCKNVFVSELGTEICPNCESKNIKIKTTL